MSNKEELINKFKLIENSLSCLYHLFEDRDVTAWHNDRSFKGPNKEIIVYLKDLDSSGKNEEMRGELICFSVDSPNNHFEIKLTVLLDGAAAYLELTPDFDKELGFVWKDNYYDSYKLRITNE